MVFLIALVAFIAAFFLPGVQTNDGFHTNIPGYFCALSSLFSPLGKDGLIDLSTKPVEYFATLFSGIINPLFIAAVAFLQIKPNYRLGKHLRAIVIGLLPACWLYFWQANFYPHVGYFLWTAAMLVALFAPSPEKHKADRVENSGPEQSHGISASGMFLLNATERASL
jgi:hypothetical protein